MPRMAPYLRSKSEWQVYGIRGMSVKIGITSKQKHIFDFVVPPIGQCIAAFTALTSILCTA